MNDIVRQLDNVIKKYENKTFYTGELNFVEMAKSCKIAIQDLLQEKAEREKPKPLTLEELKNKKWKTWIYIKTNEMTVMTSDWYKIIEPIIADFSVGYPGVIWDLDFSDYGKTWFAFDYEPKEGDDDR